MPENDQIILDQVLDQNHSALAPSLTTSEYFEIFTAEQILKDFDLSYEEIESGIVAGGGDGGIDGFYVFVNGELLQEDTDINEIRKNVQIELFLIQAKTSASFTEAVMDRFASTTEDLFDLSKPLSILKSVYNEELLEAVERFRNTYQSLASKFPNMTINFYYASKGCEVHPNVDRKSARLEGIIKKFFSSAEFSFDFVGARKLLDLARRSPTTTYELKLTEIPISTAGGVAFVCLVSLKSLFEFITDSNKKIRRQIFEANVRDYQGKTQVNEQIQDTLKNPGSEDFWWLNNGISILATRATQSGKTLNLENPDIVNGLQTSSEIHSYFTSSNTEKESRNVLIRVIVSNVAESRDRIIRATNSQTSIPSASLHATDPIHQDIEEYLKPYGLFYDRRKNHYKNEGKQIGKIVSIPQMAQAVMSIVLKQPNTARARPSSLIKHDQDYQLLFNRGYPIEIYRVCAQLIKETQSFLMRHSDNITPADRNNMKFYLAMVVAQQLLNKSKPTAADIALLVGKAVDDNIFELSYKLVQKQYHKLGGNDQVAKGKTLLLEIEKCLNKKTGKGFFGKIFNKE